MRPHTPVSSLLLALCAAVPTLSLVSGAAAPRAQEVAARPKAGSVVGPSTFRALLEDGRLLGVDPLVLSEESFSYEIGDGEAAQVAARSLIALHGQAPRPRGSHVVTLVGGEVLRGEVRGGDDLGDSFTLQSDLLGAVRVPIDRLQRLRFLGNRPEIEGSELTVPEGASEVLFVGTQRGVDRITGEILRFTRRAIRFQGENDEKATGWLFDELVALAIDGGYEREEAPDAWLVTRAGDRLGIDNPRIAGGSLQFVDETGEERTVPLRSVSALSLLGEGRQYVSALEREVVEQRSYFTDSPLYRDSTDRAVDGSLLAVGGRGGATGIGVHSRTVFSVVVPDGVSALLGGVGLDDTVEQLKVRPAVDLALKRGDEVLFSRKGLRPGELAPLGRLPVEPGQTILFEVDFGPGLDLGDRVDWLDCVFVR